MNLDKFMERVMPEPMSGCWLWTGACRAKGYGYVRHDGRSHRAHRVSWMFHFGPIPTGLWVLHKCDNPSCVNPDHLFLGTHQDNMADRHAKGRQAKGESHGRARAILTENQVKEILRLCASGMKRQEIAAAFGVHSQTIYDIKTGTTWRHLQDVGERPIRGV